MALHPALLDPDRTALLVVDVQERFRPAMAGFDAMLQGCLRLVRTFRALELPIVITEQYPRGLGHTVPELRESLDARSVPEKTAFSALGCEAAAGALSASGVRSVVVCGIETHVCVLQSVYDLLAEEYVVHVAVDAVDSREALSRGTALERIARDGTILTTSETVAFELLVDASHARFKEVQAIFK